VYDLVPILGADTAKVVGRGSHVHLLPRKARVESP